MPRIRPAITDDEVQRCWPVLRQLRPDLAPDALVPAVRRMERHGFRLVSAEDEQGVVRAVVGYRITEMLRTGTMLEIDDLVTDADARSGGYGSALFEWVLAEARAAGCSVVELDSGVQRHAAHRFYFRQRMHILGYHFSLACDRSADS
ncbi:MAG: GNAT family N-acetyltransferase [Gemmatimonadota bacterium]|nr:GNAT family N-acetyltransferase [Gemmatimonadota bacterium]